MSMNCIYRLAASEGAMKIRSHELLTICAVSLLERPLLLLLLHEVHGFKASCGAPLRKRPRFGFHCLPTGKQFNTWRRLLNEADLVVAQLLLNQIIRAMDFRNPFQANSARLKGP